MIPQVDAVIAVHTPTRPIERVVESVLEKNECAARAIVVIHNTEPEPILRRLAKWEGDDRLLTVCLNDGIKSPSGPMNLGFDTASAPWLTLIGSDDELEAGALDAWLALAQRTRAKFVLAPVRFDDGRVFSYPPVRPLRLCRGGAVHPVKDRLSYRQAPLGLIARDALGEMRFDPRYATGEDQPISLRLQFDFPSAFAPKGPGYLIHEDATDRVTFTARPVADDLAVLPNLLCVRQPWMRTKTRRVAMLSQLLRNPIRDSVLNRERGQLTPADLEFLRSLVRRIVNCEPTSERVLSRAEGTLVRALADTQADPAHLYDLALRATSFRRLDSILFTSNWRYIFHAQAPFRLRASQALLSRFGK